MIDVDRTWVQHETGQVIDGSQVDLADEPVTSLRDVIAQWQMACVTPRGHVETEEVPPPSVIHDLLMLVDVLVPVDTVRAWNNIDRRLAVRWAAAVHLSASDNDVTIPPRPAVLPL